MKAVFVKDIKRKANDHKALYKLSEKISYYREDAGEFDHVICSSVSNKLCRETFVFPADEKGNIICYGELECSSTVMCSHEEVLKDLPRLK